MWTLDNLWPHNIVFDSLKSRCWDLFTFTFQADHVCAFGADLFFLFIPLSSDNISSHPFVQIQVIISKPMYHTHINTRLSYSVPLEQPKLLLLLRRASTDSRVEACEARHALCLLQLGRRQSSRPTRRQSPRTRKRGRTPRPTQC